MKIKGLSGYQLELIQLMAALQKENRCLPDFDQLITRLSWTPTKAAAQFTIRALIKKGLIEKFGLSHRRARIRICYRLTDVGQQVLDPRFKAPEKAVNGLLPGAPKEPFEDHSGTFKHYFAEPLKPSEFPIPELFGFKECVF